MCRYHYCGILSSVLLGGVRLLKLLSNENKILQVDDFYIVEKSTGLDELIFNVSIHDENYPYILEEAIVEHEQPYVVKAIDGGASTAKVKCQLDLDELKSEMKIGYTNNSNTLAGTVNGILPEGWMFLDESGSVIQRTIEGDYTPYEILVECMNTYDVALRFKPKEKQIYAYTLKNFQPLGAFASRELNLKEINYKGKSTDFYTRLYAYGKDGLSFAEINDGKPYVDNFTYSNKVVCKVLRDERYTTAEGLLEAAKKQVEIGSIPARSYECAVYDLAKTNPEMYSFQDFSLFSVVKLIDDIKKISINYQVVEYQRYPNYPEKNIVTLSTTTAKIQNTVKNLKNEIENPQSSFRTMMQNTINNVANAIAGYDGGNLLVTHNTKGKPNGIMIMDTDSKDTAKKVLWFNLNGITYSENGAGGPFNTVWSFEQGGFVADWIVAGTLIANVIKSGILSDKRNKNYWNLDTGEMHVSGKYTMEFSKTLYASDFTEDDYKRVQNIIMHLIEPTKEDYEKYDLKGTGIDGYTLVIIQRLLMGYEEWRKLIYKVTIDPAESSAVVKTEYYTMTNNDSDPILYGSVNIGGMGIRANEMFTYETTSELYSYFSREEGFERQGTTGEFTTADGKTVSVYGGIVTSIH